MADNMTRVVLPGVPPLEYIMGQLLQEFATKFEASNREYGNMHQELGVRAQYVDMHRKMGKLRRALWDGAITDDWREGPREIILDLIGHCFLTLEIMDREGLYQQEERSRMVTVAFDGANSTVVSTVTQNPNAHDYPDSRYDGNEIGI